MTWTRADHLASLGEDRPFDVVVIGAGIVGAGIALDLAARGLSVAVVDRADFASGTSSRSSKLFHGGIRYLPQLRFGMVREGLLEQRILEEIADYLFEPLDFVLPIYEDVGFGDMPTWLSHPKLVPTAFGFGLWFYDRLGRRPKGSSKHLSPSEVQELAPALRPDRLRGGFLYRDAKTDDARLVLAALKTAVDLGSVATNWCEVVGVRSSGGRYVVDMADRLGGDGFSVEARTVVTATGAFAPPALNGEVPKLGVALSKGAHLTMEAKKLRLGSEAVVLPETDDGRIIFVVPWSGNAMVGTTDTPFDGDVAHPDASEEDIAYLQRHLLRYFDVPDVEPISAWAGLRALAAEPGESTAEASRAPVIRQTTAGFFQVAGGKLTGYRAIAEEVADDVAKHLGSPAKSTTDRLSLTGAGGSQAAVMAAARHLGLFDVYGQILYERYGRDAHQVLDLIGELGTEAIDEQLQAAEVRYAVRNESATTISDLTLRRTRLSWETPDHGRTAAPAIAEVLADELGWTDERKAAELVRFEQELQAEGL